MSESSKYGKICPSCYSARGEKDKICRYCGVDIENVKPTQIFISQDSQIPKLPKPG